MAEDTDQYTRVQRLRRLSIIYSLVCAYLFLQHIIMPKTQNSEPKKATWSDQETEQLISFLNSEAERTGNTSFQDSTYNTAAERIRGLHTTGVLKTGKHCKGKWRTVSTLRSVLSITSDLLCLVENKVRRSR